MSKAKNTETQERFVRWESVLRCLGVAENLELLRNVNGDPMVEVTQCYLVLHVREKTT